MCGGGLCAEGGLCAGGGGLCAGARLCGGGVCRGGGEGGERATGCLCWESMMAMPDTTSLAEYREAIVVEQVVEKPNTRLPLVQESRDCKHGARLMVDHH